MRERRDVSSASTSAARAPTRESAPKDRHQPASIGRDHVVGDPHAATAPVVEPSHGAGPMRSRQVATGDVTIGLVRSCRGMTADDQLHGWKDISRHLGVQVRTAQRYEKRGLPIRRNDAIRGGVYAVKAELQVWRDGFGSSAGSAVTPITAWHAMVTLSEPLAPGRYVVSIALTGHASPARQA